MASLKVKDGAGYEKTLQVTVGGDGFIQNHTLVSTVTGAVVNKYSADGGWTWDGNYDGTVVAQQDNTRLGLIINNNTKDYENGNCYVILGNNDFVQTPNAEQKPELYSFVLEAGGMYIADSSTAALKHSIYVVSSSFVNNADTLSILVTQIYQ